MRYGIFSDVHGNLEAFEAVMGALSKESVDQYISPGDIVGYGADPSKCIGMMEGLSLVTVAGNHDWAIGGLFDPLNLKETAREAVLWTEAVLSWEEIGYLKSLELTIEKDDFALTHGSLESPADFSYIFNERDARPTFKLMRAPLCFIGHTHVPAIFHLPSSGGVKHRKEHKIKVCLKDKYIVNVGSVGQPRDGDPRASYAVYDDEKKTVEIKRVEYDVKKAQDKILNAGLPDTLAYRLSTGS